MICWPNVRDLPLGNIELSVRTHNVLVRAKCRTLGKVLDITEEEVLAMRHAGVKTWREIQEMQEHFAQDKIDDTLRQHYAALAMQGLIQAYATQGSSPTSHMSEICREAVSAADELLYALKETS
jgi:hypothetical protein